MIKNPVIPACAAVLLLIAGCGSEEIVDPNKLCKDGAGLGARIDGMAATVDMCVSDNDTDALYETVPAARYEISGAFTSGAVTITIRTEFLVHTAWPVQLTLTPDIVLAQGDPNFVYFSYRETQTGQDDRSMDVAGTFTLTFSDASIAVATFSNVAITLESAASPGTAVGTRMIPEGFVSVTAD